MYTFANRSHLPEIDEFSAYRTLLLHGDGTNNGTVFTDSSLNALSGTRVNNAVTLADVSSFGGSAIRYYQGPSSYVEFVKSGGFINSSSWTIEFIFQVEEQSSGFASGTNYNTVIGFRNGTNTPQRIIGQHASGMDFLGLTLTAPLIVGQRHKFMIGYTGSELHVYQNGTRIYNYIGTYTIDAHDRVFVGNFNGVGTPYADWSHGALIEEVRITDGLCLQTGASYSVQTAAFPNPT